MIWGYAGVWPGQFIRYPEQKLRSWVEFLVDWELQCTGVSVWELGALDPADGLFDFLAEHDLHLTIGVGGIYFGERGEVARKVDEALEIIRRFKDAARTPIITGAVGRVHRFMRDPSLKQQLDTLTKGLTPLASGCHEMGLGFGLENHGDYYCSDIVTLCGRVPNLSIFLDTGNCYLIGERVLPAVREAAPYTIGTHFKDHHVRPRPDTRPLSFEVAPAVLGDGDVGLREVYDILLQNAPNPESLVMEIELIPPKDPRESLQESLTFIRSLPNP
jgi:sugar phosphate isomerase/epimerase